nr:InlB B-repeat-containing protein [Saccharofermentans sp.]
DLWVGGIQVTSANASNVLGDTGTPTVVYDADTNTLTLNGATITGPDSEVLGWNAGGGIVYSGTEDFTIKVTGGTSTVTGGNNRDRSAGLLIADPRYVFSGSSNPCKTTIIIDEGATLTLIGGVPNSYSACSVGLLCDTNGGLTITGSGTLNAAGSGASNIDVSYGIYTQKKLTIDGPTVNASGADSFVSVGIYSNYGLIIENGTVTTTAGYSARNGAWSYGVMANNGFAINGGTVTAKSYISALNTSVTLGDGVTASGSTNMNGSDAVSYVAADSASYKWFSTTFTPLTYGISLDKTGTYTFTEATVGYSALTPATVTVTNTGTGSTGNLTVALSGSNPGCFTLSKTSLSGIAANGSDTFTIVPNTGLAPATYSTTVTVTGENNISATFKVSFKVNPVMYTVTITGGIADKETAAAGETVTVYADSIPEGKEFDKWVADSDDVVFYNASAEETNFTMPASDVEITATYKDVKYTVTFNANGHGTAPAAQSVTYGGKATKPADLTATGWTFSGWYTDAACTKAYNFSSTVTANVTLYAKWTQVKYTVTFNANGHGTAPAAQSVAYGGKASKPSDPSATGWTFGGWYTDAACTKAYDFGTTVTANVTLYAKWTVVPTPSPSPTPVPSANLLGSGMAHVQDFGDTPVSVDPATGILTIGTTGMGKRLEEITINFTNTTPYVGTLQYRVHVQNIGWMDWVNAGQPAGTEGMALRIEAIELRLTGELAQYYSVEYCVHIEDYGDMQGWVKDGALAGTTGESKRIEEIKIRIVPRGTGTMSVKYRVHVQDYGWEKSYATNGAMSGTSGESKRLEGIEIFLSGTQYCGGIKFKTHVQDYGWQDWSYDGEMSGTQGESKRLEGICIELYGEIAEYYDIYYRVHAQDIGWMGWAKNGECAGTAGRSARLEGIQIVLVPKGQPAPGATYQGITAVTTAAFVEGF